MVADQIAVIHLHLAVLSHMTNLLHQAGTSLHPDQCLHMNHRDRRSIHRGLHMTHHDQDMSRHDQQATILPKWASECPCQDQLLDWQAVQNHQHQAQTVRYSTPNVCCIPQNSNSLNLRPQTTLKHHNSWMFGRNDELWLQHILF